MKFLFGYLIQILILIKSNGTCNQISIRYLFIRYYCNDRRWSSKRINYDLMNLLLKFPQLWPFFLVLFYGQTFLQYYNPDKLVVDRPVTKEACWKQCETRNAGHGSVSRACSQEHSFFHASSSSCALKLFARCFIRLESVLFYPRVRGVYGGWFGWKIK